MKRVIPIVIIVSIIIVSALRACWSGDDDVSEDNNKAVEQIPIDKALQSRTDSFITAQKTVGTLGLMIYDITARRIIDTYHSNV